MRNALIGRGIYTVPEASRLTGVSPWRVRRWLKGYEFQAKTGTRKSPPVWGGQLPRIDHALALGFLDLLEVRCVDAFIKAGVSWKTLRQIHDKTKQRLGHEHPFCTSRFVTDGSTIFLEAREKNDEVMLWDMRDVQRVFDRIIEPFLKNLEFGSRQIPQRWWPMGKEHRVALDPKRSFGQPIILEDGIPTQVLARSVQANQSVKEVARWFEINPQSVEAAVEFEQQLAA